MTFIVIITRAIDKKYQVQRLEVTAAGAVVSTWQQSAELSRRYCSFDTEERKRPKDSACILNTADMSDLLPGHYRQRNDCNVAYVA